MHSSAMSHLSLEIFFVLCGDTPFYLIKILLSKLFLMGFSSPLSLVLQQPGVVGQLAAKNYKVV